MTRMHLETLAAIEAACGPGEGMASFRVVGPVEGTPPDEVPEAAVAMMHEGEATWVVIGNER